MKPVVWGAGWCLARSAGPQGQGCALMLRYVRPTAVKLIRLTRSQARSKLEEVLHEQGTCRPQSPRIRSASPKHLSGRGRPRRLVRADGLGFFRSPQRHRTAAGHGQRTATGRGPASVVTVAGLEKTSDAPRAAPAQNPVPRLE